MSAPDQAGNFYARLDAFTTFDKIIDLAAYRPFPDDWVVLTGDIEASTRAIAEGRYKAVNMMGAAAITCVLNACGKIELPFVFGGDGGAVVVPPDLADAGAEALRRLQALAAEQFRLALRAAAVPVARLRAEGADLRVARLRLNGTNHLAMFAGGGLDLADKILKRQGPAEPCLLRSGPGTAPPDLAGLSCRWEPLTSVHGRMIALMVRPLGERDAAAALTAILAELAAILGGDIRGHAPARRETLRFRWPPRGLGLEVGATGAERPFRARAAALVTSLVQKWCHWRGARVGPYDGPAYEEELAAQTDFRKFDGCLRLVLDCTETEIAQIERWLDAAYRDGRLVYGLHADRQALMTCLVFSLEESTHVHFVDAAGGGFAKAAEAFKIRLRTANQRASQPPQ